MWFEEKEQDTSATEGCFSTRFSPGTFGNYMSLGLSTAAIVISIILQQYAAKFHSWDVDCPEDYEETCEGHSAVLRVSFALALIFFLQVVGTLMLTRYFDFLWPFKILLFVVLLVSFFFVESSVFDLSGYAWVARVLGFIFIIVQAIIVIDVAYTWNEKWTSYAEALNGGENWYTGLVIVSVVLFAISITAIGFMFEYFGGCQDADVILSLSVVFPFFATLIQLFIADEGVSLLTSAILTSYSTYICYSAVTLNPNTECNPTLSTKYQTVSTILGLILVAISLVYTAWKAVTLIPMSADHMDNTFGLGDVTSVANANNAGSSRRGPRINPYSLSGMKSLLSQVSIVYLLIAGYYAMVLTNWATLQGSSEISSPQSGTTAMWMQAVGQWIAMILYVWSMIAPKIWPDRFGSD